MRKREGNEEVLYVTSAILVEKWYVRSGYPKDELETYNMISKPPTSTTCSGRFSSSQSNATTWGESGGWMKYLALRDILWDRIGIADAMHLDKRDNPK